MYKPNLNKPQKKAPPKGIPFKPTQKALIQWRNEIWKRDYTGVTWTSASILSDSLVEFLSSIGSISDRDTLSQLISRKWMWWERYGDELAELVLSLKTEYHPLPSSDKKSKRKNNDALSTEGKRSKTKDSNIPVDPPGSLPADMGGRFINCR